jgi:hypothetical protein
MRPIGPWVPDVVDHPCKWLKTSPLALQNLKVMAILLLKRLHHLSKAKPVQSGVNVAAQPVYLS